MRFIQEFGYTVKVGQEEAHQKWLVDNDQALAKSMPPGTRCIGTFAVVYSSEKSSGWYRKGGFSRWTQRSLRASLMVSRSRESCADVR